MTIYAVTNSGEAGASGLSFSDAIVAANTNPGADIIRFDPGLQLIFLDDVSAISGILTIEGDADGDEISDAILAADDTRHLMVSEGSTVTIRNVDFVSG